MVLRFDLRMTEKSRLAMAAAAIKPRMITRNSAREFWPLMLGERRESTSDDIVADWHGKRKEEEVAVEMKVE